MKDRGYKVVAYPVTPPLITTESVRGTTQIQQELKQAGLDEVRAEIQRQLDAWRVDHP
ncbi:DUF3502 domain-containing protein [Paenibacillus taichungensis]|uniref:DUF3502 domain-containing protein n=1 Tax=Paenibacillus taichungensis TaxID=484184 RepID=UPI0015C5F9EF|nr:DUF3502 domain-containing protein [Paenibacillus taichungensis]